MYSIQYSKTEILRECILDMKFMNILLDSSSSSNIYKAVKSLIDKLFIDKMSS